ncbi:hypothetical protein [Micromonospora sp. WMMD812]|uniref:hypothetical protein n=1 Tax=Micromonospora sp. WMMD812 TaxID=3015152 RepID=UPI00248BA187|nr:hypothetical protein [Micromonospora sp. WMMD812]WBB65335.1 hypothetical protein O7603_19190 [Micromonospora sp. WMMD812]
MPPPARKATQASLIRSACPAGAGAGARRQRFLAEQGYAATIMDADDVLGPELPTID